MAPGTQKFLTFVIVVLACIAADQSSKMWAEARLANPTRNPTLIDGPKSFTITVPADRAGQDLTSFLRDDLTGTPDSEVDLIARSWTLVDGARVTNPVYPLRGGERLTVRSRKVEVIPGFFHFRYTRNPGAAFGFMADQDSNLRKPFFVLVSLIAISIILWIFRRVHPSQKLLVWSLSLIVGGAIGNFIDRVLYGWVIDFIDWHYNRAFTWPTFNVADAAITLGVALMILEIALGFISSQRSELEPTTPNPTPS